MGGDITTPWSDAALRFQLPAADARLARAHSHPVRARAMELFESHVARPKDIAAWLHEPLGAVAYHVRYLQQAGLIELVERSRTRGAVQHYYTAHRGPTITDGEWEALPVSHRRAVIAGGLHRLGPRLAAATSNGGFSRRGTDIDVIPLHLRPRDWRVAGAVLHAALSQIEELIEAAKFRLHENRTVDTARALVVLMLFKSPRVTGRARLLRTSAEPIDLVDPRMIAGTAHPLRSDIFQQLCERPASPSDLAKAVRAPLGNTSYHVRRLAEMGLVRLVDRRERHGAIEHYYAAAVAPTIVEPEWHSLIEDSCAANAASLAMAAARDGGFDADDIHLTRTPFPIDDECWEGVVGTLTDARAALRRLQVGARKSGRTTEQAHVMTMLFDEGREIPNPAAAPASPHR